MAFYTFQEPQINFNGIWSGRKSMKFMHFVTLKVSKFVRKYVEALRDYVEIHKIGFRDLETGKI